ncbi:MAG: beta-lactamase family protein [Gemmatimonadetes bacterium]|nr:beta-lactamase family protein [Gemmatimonadota bacterium]
MIREGELAHARCYGYGNLDYGTPIEPETVFGIGSTSKQFTAAAVLLASRQGHLSLDEYIRKWIPESPDFIHDITVRHLAHHTSGIRDEALRKAVGNLPDLSPD